MTFGEDRLNSSRLRTAAMRTPHTAVIPPTDDFHVRSQQTMRTAAMRADGTWCEGEMRAIQDRVRPVSWSRPSDMTVVIDALMSGAEVPLRAWRPQKVDFAVVEADVADMAERVATVVHPLREVIARSALDALDTVRAIAESRRLGDEEGNAVATEWSARRYGAPTAETLEHAHALLNQPWWPPAPEPTFDAAQAAFYLRQCLGALAPGWTVEIAQQVAAMMIDGSNSTVVVNKDYRFTPTGMARLLVHEVGGHVMRWVNAAANPGSMASVPLGNDGQGTEEGLAAWWEQRLGVADAAVLRIYAARTVAVSVALRGSIHDVVVALAPHLPLPEAARIAVRVKRGLPDPAAPGAFTKDHGYLAGFDAVTAYLHRFPDRLPDLMAAKWGLSVQPCIEVVRGEGLLPATPRLPERDLLLAPLMLDAGFRRG